MEPVDDEFKRRAEERRRRMTGGIARSFEELDRAGREFWDSASFSAKLEATHDAIIEAWVIQGYDTPPRFDGSTWGVLKFER